MQPSQLNNNIYNEHMHSKIVKAQPGLARSARTSPSKMNGLKVMDTKQVLHVTHRCKETIFWEQYAQCTLHIYAFIRFFFLVLHSNKLVVVFSPVANLSVHFTVLGPAHPQPIDPLYLRAQPSP